HDLRNAILSVGSRRCGRVRNEDDVVRIVAGCGLSFWRERADDLEWHLADLDVLTNRLVVAEESLYDGVTDHGHGALPAYIISSEECAVIRRPIANRLIVGVDAVDRRAPIALR